MSDAAVRPCPVCGASTEAGDAFCEVCGSLLKGDGVGKGAAPPGARPSGGSRAGLGVPEGAAALEGSASLASGGHSPLDAAAPTLRTGPFGRTAPCAHCGASPDNIDDDGYCGVCGRRQPGPRDHHEVDFGWCAGVTDKGHRHPTNQDAFHLEPAGPPGDHGVVAVVCDGVSSSVHAEEAAESAATAAGSMLAAAVLGTRALDQATVDAARAANDAVSALPWTAVGSLASPSCTLVSAASRAGEVAVGSVGDSRVYWLGPPDGVRRLTVDDSWAEAEVEAGRMTEEEAEADLRSHAITRWVGADAPDGDARVVTVTPQGPGRLLLCSDGLWNYAPTTTALAEVLSRQPDPSTPLELARSLTSFALDAGGHDNITVVVIELPGPAVAHPTTDDPEPRAHEPGPKPGGFEPGSPAEGGFEPGSPEEGSPGLGSPEEGSPEAGSPEAGSPEAGSPEAGSPISGGSGTTNSETSTVKGSP